jgi:hypothetical protein
MRRFQCGPCRIKESIRLVLPRTTCFIKNLLHITYNYSILIGSLVTTAWRVLRLQMEMASIYYHGVGMFAICLTTAGHMSRSKASLLIFIKPKAAMLLLYISYKHVALTPAYFTKIYYHISSAGREVNVAYTSKDRASAMF